MTLPALHCRRVTLALALASLAGLAACSKPASGDAARAGDLPVDAAFAKHLQEQLLDAKPGTVVEIPAGRFSVGSRDLRAKRQLAGEG